MQNYKVCILAAGIGARMGKLSAHANKAIFPVNFKAAISYIIEKFPAEIEIVVAVGYKKASVIDYLAIAHPDRKITFIEIDKYTGPGTGPGYSLLQCEKAIQRPFIFFSTDTIVLEDIPAPDKNWFGIASINTPERFCTVAIEDNLICRIDDKVKTDNKFAFIGAAGIYDYDVFFRSLAADKSLICGELQVSNGFRSLIGKKLVPLKFTWFDTGTFNSYVETNKYFSGKDSGFDFSKSDEFLYFAQGTVIKYFADADIVEKRCRRAGLLKDICPEIIAKCNNFYAYRKVNGQILYNVLDRQLAGSFFAWAKSRLWKRQELDENGQRQFSAACRNFYFNKTQKRLRDFYEKTGLIDGENNINGRFVPSLKRLFESIDWDYICAGIPAVIHGDLQFDNVIVSPDEAAQCQKFRLIDWRQDFGGLTAVGDLYYDLAKLYAGMIISYQSIKRGMFSFNLDGPNVFYNYHTDNTLQEAREEYEMFIKENGFDLPKITIMSGLIFLNMAALHNYPFDHLLFFLGKNTIHNMVSKKCLQPN
ncbi:MAG: hypothetical protein V1662_03510 [Candidatus Omnitrophota bacterium]